MMRPCRIIKVAPNHNVLLLLSLVQSNSGDFVNITKPRCSYIRYEYATPDNRVV